MNAGSMGKLNGLAFLYYFVTTLVAVTVGLRVDPQVILIFIQIGLALVMLIHPGHPDKKVQSEPTRKIPENVQLHTVIYDLIMYGICSREVIDLPVQKSFSWQHIFCSVSIKKNADANYCGFKSDRPEWNEWIQPHSKQANGTNGKGVDTVGDRGMTIQLEELQNPMALSEELAQLMNLTKSVLDKASNATSFDTVWLSMDGHRTHLIPFRTLIHSINHWLIWLREKNDQFIDWKGNWMRWERVHRRMEMWSIHSLLEMDLIYSVRSSLPSHIFSSILRSSRVLFCLRSSHIVFEREGTIPEVTRRRNE